MPGGLTKIFKEDRADYILSLQQAQDDETNQPFLDFMAVQLKKITVFGNSKI